MVVITTVMKMYSGVKLWFLMGGALVLLSACDAPQESVQNSGPPPILTEKQRAFFNATCINCHGAEDTGAPQIGDGPAWDKRWEKGFDVLFLNTANGFQGMPGLGGCGACSQEDLEILIQYLAGRSVVKKGEVVP